MLAKANLLVIGLAVAALALLWYLIYVVGDAMPHVPESVGYVFQAKLFASFRTAADVPPVLRSFSFSDPSPIQAMDGHWFSQYPFGHPLFLAFGQLFRAMWLVPPVLGSASVFLIYRVGHHVYGAAVGVLAALLLFFSPFFQMTASNFMSHNTAVFALLLCLLLYVRPTKRRILSLCVSGVLLGLLFNIRPLTAVAFMPALGGLMTYEFLRRPDDRATLLREYAAFASGSVLLLLAYFLYNQVTTGDFLTSGYALTDTYSDDSFGFGGGHSVALGLQNLQQLLAFMLLVANGWPVAVGLSIAALPFILGTRHRWDYFLAGSVLSLAVAVILYRNAAVMHGPRFWYETMPFLMLLTARGVDSLREASITAADWFARRVGRAPQVTSGGVVGVVLFGLIAGLIAFSAYGWMIGRRDAWSGIPSTPQKMSMLEGFNSADRRLLDRADEMDLENALVLVEDCTHWWCYGSVFWTNSPDLDGDIVWAERAGADLDQLLLESFEGRDLYVADYDAGTIRSASRAEIVPITQPP
jgi:4-amino-4-deoxy-L-arabinose transferase-like glycosyltransferase